MPSATCFDEPPPHKQHKVNDEEEEEEEDKETTKEIKIAMVKGGEQSPVVQPKCPHRDELNGCADHCGDGTRATSKC